MKTLVCCIAKCENNYIREWVEHYLKIGYSKIVICDNNDKDGERFDEVIKDYIDDGIVDIIDYRGYDRGMSNLMNIAYGEVYKKYCGNYHWLSFFDCDEFLELEKYNNISLLLNHPRFAKANVIRVCWKTFDDSGEVRVKNNNYSVTRFTHIMEEDLTKESRDIFDNNNIQCKMIIRGGLKCIAFSSSHSLKDKSIIAYNCKGEICNNTNRFIGKEPVWEVAWLNHYRFKTTEEYVVGKIKRGYACHSQSDIDKMLTLDTFFRFNKRTKEKEEVALKLMK